MPSEGGASIWASAASLRRPAGALRSARVEFTLFETLAEDLIQFIPNSQSTVLAQNFDRRAFRGAELRLPRDRKALQRQPERHPPGAARRQRRPRTGVFCRDDRKTR